MKESAQLEIYGSKRKADLSIPEFSLRKGWNLIGTFSQGFSSNVLLRDVNYESIYGFEKNQHRYDVLDPDTELNETEGYWIYVEDATLFTPGPRLSPSDNGGRRGR